MTKQELQLILPEGEGPFIEFKEKLDKRFPREIVTLANTSSLFMFNYYLQYFKD